MFPEHNVSTFPSIQALMVWEGIRFQILSLHGNSLLKFFCLRHLSGRSYAHTLMCLSATLLQMGLTHLMKRNIPSTDLERYCDGCPARWKIWVMGPSKILWCWRSLLCSTIPSPVSPTILLRKIWISNKIFFYFTINFSLPVISVFFFSLKGPILIHCLLLIMINKYRKNVNPRTLFPKNIFKIQFSFVTHFVAATIECWVFRNLSD